jgi:predicted LPLAT superfamily acyltransferase
MRLARQQYDRSDRHASVEPPAGLTGPQAGDQSATWATRGERGAAAAIKLIVWVALRLGRRTTRLLLYPICLYFLAFSPAARRQSARYLRRVLGRAPGFSDCFRHYHCFASCALDRVYLLNDQMHLLDIRVTGEAIALAQMEHDKGCFLFGAHVGSFEVLRSLGHTRAGLKLSLLMYEENARKINAALNAINPALSLEVIALGHAESLLTVGRRLDEGHFVGILADRGLKLPHEEHLRIDFLGEPAAFPLGPFKLAALLRRPIILMVGLYRGGGRYDIAFESIADFRTSARETQDVEIQQALRRFVARLEHYCRLDPYNWFNFYDFWR